MTSDTDQYSGIGFTKGTSNKWYLRTLANASDLRLYNYTLSADQMFWGWTSGFVGIGTDTPSAELDVAGNIIADDPTSASHVATKGYVDDRLVENLNDGNEASTIDIEPTTPVKVVVLSKQISDIAVGDIIQVFAEYQVSCSYSYGPLLSTHVIIGSTAAATSGWEVSEANGSHLEAKSGITASVTKVGTYEATSALGTKYVNVVAWAAHGSAGASHTLSINSNSGRLSVVRHRSNYD